MLKREKNTYTVFKQAMIRNFTFLRIQEALYDIFESVNEAFAFSKDELMEFIPDSFQETPTYQKFEENIDAYSIIDKSLEDDDIPVVVDTIKCLPVGKQIENALSDEFLDEEVIQMYLPQIKEGIHLIRDNPLYQDILVSAVAAFEVYLRDTLHDLIANNKEIAKKFEQDVKDRLNIDEDLPPHRSTRQIIAHEVTRRSFFNVNNIEAMYHQCFYRPGKKAYKIHTSKNKRNSVQFYLQLRNLLVHSGGIVDQKFLKAVKDCKYKKGEQYPVEKREVLEFMGYTEGIVDRIEEEIRKY